MSEINILRTTRHKKYQKYSKNKTSYERNTSYVAVNQSDEVVASCDFLILNQKEAVIDQINYFNDNLDLYHQFIEEFNYWNPFIKTIKYQDKIKKIEKPADIYKIPLLDIRVEQLSVSQKKLEQVLKWIKKEEDVIINVVKIDEEMVCIDGYSRLMAAYLKGFNYIYCFYEKESDISDYKTFLQWCEDERLFTIKDLEKKIVSDEAHQKIWIDRCQTYFKNKQK